MIILFCMCPGFHLEGVEKHLKLYMMREVVKDLSPRLSVIVDPQDSQNSNGGQRLSS